jgi:HEPN domain-containing protein
MALPHAKEARPYYQAAKQRLGDAQFLLDAGRSTGAIYLAGYSVECMLKALILATLPAKKRAEMLDSFRGAKAHDYDWLKARYSESGGQQIPKDISKRFLLANTWTVELRYKAGTAKHRDARDFLSAAEEILAWADERL